MRRGAIGASFDQHLVSFPGAFRLVLYLQYCTTREITNVFDVDRFRHDPVKHLAVAHSVEQGRGLADKYEMGG